jgi:hypothetical protein
MAKKTEATREPGSVFDSCEPSSRGKPYEVPILVEWGSILDLTAGPFADVQDDDFSGSNAV